MPSPQKPLEFRITGMDCAEEVAVLRRVVGPLVGGEDRLAFDILNGKMIVQQPEGITAERIMEAIARAGMRAELWRERDTREPAGFWPRWGRILLTATSGAFLLIGLVTHVWLSGGVRASLGSEGLGTAESVPLSVRLLYSLGIVAGVWFVLPKACYSLRRLQPDMNLLMTVAVIGAVAIGEWFEAATVAFLFALSLLLESWSIGRARRAIAALMDLAPPTARIRQANGAEVEIPAGEVEIGAIVIVKPGERLPVDGRVAKGLSDINQGPITGESQPVPKKPGDEVYAGTINGDGALEIESTKAAADTTLARIIRMVGEAQSRRAPSEAWVEKFARVYTPAVMALSIAVLLVPPLLFGQEWSRWLYNALVLLVIACPCALVISTPVSIVAALTAAARQGVLIKGGLFVEAPARLKAIAFDKTGTLTRGRPAVVEVVPLSGHDEREVLERAAAMESRSDHPLAAAIVAYADRQGIQPSAAEDMQIIQGKGATARFDGRPFWLGSHRYLEERKQETPEVHARLETMSGQGRTVVVIGNDQHVCGLIALADQVRPEAGAALGDLRQAGIQHLVMLTGDNGPTAQAIAKQVGVDDVRAELLPQDKIAAVEELVARYGNVAMVGDGVNDAPAMARATLGIAMGAVGTDAAIETADIALMSDDLSRLPWLIQHSQRALTIIRQNIILALSVKGLFVILTLGGAASLWTAIAADMGTSFLVIFNGLRLLRQQPAGAVIRETATYRSDQT